LTKKHLQEDALVQNSYKEEPEDLIEDAAYLGASETGKKPADVIIKKVSGKPYNSVARASKSAGGKKSRRPKGKKYTPASDDYDKVLEMVTVGIDQHTIAKIMGISVQTLHKYYKKVLETGAEQRNAEVAGVAYAMAVSGESPSMTTFWLKTRAGWSPKHTVQVEDTRFDIGWAADQEDIADASSRDKVH